MDDSVSWLSPSDSGHTSLEDSYIVGVLIGRGSYSMVHKCLHKGKTERACKVYKKAHLEPKSVPSHISTILKLNHPHLACVHEVFEMPHELQVVVDLMTGEELLERIERSEHYSEKDASRVVCTILSVLQYLHSQQLPHGSVYPENLLYESEAPNAKLKLSEISIPKMSHSPTTLSIYIAPEFNCEMSKSKLRCSADIWSLGILIFIMLFGVEPTVEELTSQILGENEDNWLEISASARDLIVKEDPALRLTAEEALQHTWVCGSSVATKHLPDAQERLKNFNARRKLRATAHAIIATQRAMSIVKPFKHCQATR
ncbi:calcium/calmodulin-dependent protein kinase type IV-like isoform X3 [Macrosteles quadrilineatus]|uniref:calcium/calmodulin-dependent protein kinase type IV-like isoform X3 n=1 Tax=Macrosteles quadrilineatus TaxID=74068 RepID=UPI0023E154E4|nr:calcium/calmodulin-dependent protein kinase type IV-like isoform X3 [Macrosteles quadrilineatus]